MGKSCFNALALWAWGHTYMSGHFHCGKVRGTTSCSSLCKGTQLPTEDFCHSPTAVRFQAHLFYFLSVQKKQVSKWSSHSETPLMHASQSETPLMQTSAFWILYLSQLTVAVINYQRKINWNRWKVSFGLQLWNFSSGLYVLWWAWEKHEGDCFPHGSQRGERGCVCGVRPPDILFKGTLSLTSFLWPLLGKVLWPGNQTFSTSDSGGH